MSDSSPVDRPLVSIGLPVFNGEHFVAATLDSLLSQTFRDFELIISDNGSTDSTPQICERAAYLDHRVRYVRHERNRGAAWNYNHTVTLARGTYFMWTGHDDLRDPTHLEQCVAEFETGNDGLALVYPQTMLINQDGEPLQRYNDGLHLPQGEPNSRARLLLLNLGLANAVFGLIRLETLRATNLIRPFVSSDLLLLYELALRGQFHEVPYPLFQRRIHGGMSQVANSTATTRLAWFTGRPGTDRLVLPRTRLFTEMTRATLVAPIGRMERARCMGRLLQTWGPKYAKHIVRELLGAGVILFARLVPSFSKAKVHDPTSQS